MKTLAELTGTTGLPVDVHLVLDLVIPVNDGLQAQGDLLVIPLGEIADQVAVKEGATWLEVPAGGVELLRGEAGGNAHTLVADPDTCLWTADVTDTLELAIGVIDTMSSAYLLHREHGGTGIAPGQYVVRRQREHATADPLAFHRPDWSDRLGAHRDMPRALFAERRQQRRVRFVAD
jgi:hypothetical protein